MEWSGCGETQHSGKSRAVVVVVVMKWPRSLPSQEHSRIQDTWLGLAI
jgi:hypothetical protein